MRYRLRTLMIMLAVGPPLLAGAWFGYLNAVAAYRAYRVAMMHLPMPSDLTDIRLDETGL